MSMAKVTQPVPRAATSEDAAAITDLLVDAFAEDLMWGSSWAFPDPNNRREQRRAVFRLLVDGALRHPWVWVTGQVNAASLWVPPGGSELSADQESALETFLATSVPEAADRLLAGFALIEAARPREPHFYLTLLGSSPRLAGRGIGLRLLRHTLALIDATGTPAYLEASTALVPFYEHVGFNVRGSFALPQGPTVNTMWRPAVTPAPTA